MGQIEYTNQLKKFVRSLHTNKYRQKYDKFIAEGPKVCNEFIISDKYVINHIFCTADWYEENVDNISEGQKALTAILKEKELAQISCFKTANKLLLVLERNIGESTDYNSDNWSFYLDRIQDPGNMGTIMRIADWYGIQKIYASNECVDIYNPKVVQSAMGSHNRVVVASTNVTFFKSGDKTVYGLDLGGSDIGSYDKPKPGIIAIGNESKGLSLECQQYLTHRVMIPRIGGAESLNAAVACGIACHQLTTKSK